MSHVHMYIHSQNAVSSPLLVAITLPILVTPNAVIHKQGGEIAIYLTLRVSAICNGVWGSVVVAACHPMKSSTTGVGEWCGGVGWWLHVIQCRAVQQGVGMCGGVVWWLDVIQCRAVH
jgi:hypothetical protein